MRDYIKAPFVVPGMILVLGSIIAAFFIRYIESDMLFMFGAFMCSVAAFIGVSPTLNYINEKNQK